MGIHENFCAIFKNFDPDAFMGSDNENNEDDLSYDIQQKPTNLLKNKVDSSKLNNLNKNILMQKTSETTQI